MKNAIEMAAIARNVADYIIDHLLVEEPISATELESLAMDIADDRGASNAEEIESIAAMAVNYVSTDRVNMSPREGMDSRLLWFTHKG